MKTRKLELKLKVIGILGELIPPIPLPTDYNFLFFSPFFFWLVKQIWMSLSPPLPAFNICVFHSFFVVSYSAQTFVLFNLIYLYIHLKEKIRSVFFLWNSYFENSALITLVATLYIIATGSLQVLYCFSLSRSSVCNEKPYYFILFLIKILLFSYCLLFWSSIFNDF